jgi:hypothetical protein
MYTLHNLTNMFKHKNVVYNGVEGQPATSVNPFKTFGIVSTYPNPANEFTNISFNLPAIEKARFCLYNIAGQRVYECNFSGTVGQNARSINLNSLSAGVYMMSVEVGRQRAFTKITVVN